MGPVGRGWRQDRVPRQQVIELRRKLYREIKKRKFKREINIKLKIKLKREIERGIMFNADSIF